MSRLSIAGALVFASLLGGAGCTGVEDEEVQIVRSALDTVNSSIRGYGMGAGGQSGVGSLNAVIYRHPTDGSVNRRTGTPLGLPSSLGGNLAPGSAPWGYQRTDSVSVVLYTDVNRHVHQVTPSGSGFVDLDYNAPPLFAPEVAPAANGLAPDVIGYVRSDGRNAVIYRSSNDLVIEILSESGGWVVNSLLGFAGAQVGVEKGSPFPYRRSDGCNTVIYIGNDNHIHELANCGGGWGDYDLSAYTGDTTAPSSDPWAYRRSDGWNSIVYVATDGKMHELAFHSSFGWGAFILPASFPSFGLARRPSGYVRADGLNAVVYIDTDANVHELLLQGGGWVDSVLPTNNVVASGQIFGRRAPLGRSSVLFKATNAAGEVGGYELSRPNGGAWGLQAF